MEFVFGSTLICPNLETAKIVAFELQKRVRAVTLDGELFEPHGTLSGGSKTRSKSLLLSLQHNNALQNSILKLKKNLGALDEKAENLKKSNSFETKTEKLQLMEHQFLSSIRRNKNLRGIELKEEIQSTEKEIHILQKSKNEMSEKLSELSRLIEDLSEKSALDDNSNRDMKSLRAEFLRNEDELPRLRRRVEEAAMEERTAKEEIAKTEEAKTQNLANLAKFENEIEQIGKSIARFEDERETARADLERANSEIAFLSKRIAAENREIARAEAKKEEKRIESKKVQNELNRY
ncbi:Structural maintenance of chromosomes protein 2, partial [Bonamia ostreae]